MDTTISIYVALFFESLIFLFMAMFRTYDLHQIKKKIGNMPIASIQDIPVPMPPVNMNPSSYNQQPKMTREQVMQKMKEGRDRARAEKLRAELALLEQNKQ